MSLEQGMPAMDLMTELGELALASRLRRLGDRLSRDAVLIYEEMGIGFDPRWFTLFFALSRRSPQSPGELAEQLGVTHTAVIQIAAQMEKHGLLEGRRDSKDERRRLLLLSRAGRRRLARLSPVWEQIRGASAELLGEAGSSLLADLAAVERSLDEKPMAERVRTRLFLPPGGSIEIVDYRPAYKKHFRSLNEAWLREHFSVEAEDEALLGDPNRRILKRGGAILFALAGDRVAGTCALLRHGEGLFELGKLAVAGDLRRRGIGAALLDAGLARAAELGAPALYLHTSDKLKAANALYRRAGFRRVSLSPLPPHNYGRSTITMRRVLT